MMKVLIRVVIISISLGLCINAFSASNISKVTYKWTDANGIVQYTGRPPANRSYEKITINASGGEEVVAVSADAASENPEETTQGALDDVVKANDRNCKIAKQNLEVLANMARIRVSDEKGADRILSPAEKTARVAETQKQVDIYCKDISAS